MADLWSYSLDDALLFSPRVYYRMFESHNLALWPAQVLALVFGISLLFLVFRSGRGPARTSLAICGVAWLWIAVTFFWQRYATINWAVSYVAPIVGLQGMLMLWFGAARGWVAFDHTRSVRTLGLICLLIFALIGYPLIAPALGRPWAGAEIFGMFPDPTSVATLAVLGIAAGRIRWCLMVIPFFWCWVTGLTLWAMNAPDFFVAPVCSVLAVMLALKFPQQR